MKLFIKSLRLIILDKSLHSSIGKMDAITGKCKQRNEYRSEAT